MADLQSFLHLLEREGELARVTVPVDPELEITEIATRVVKRQGPALLFDNVKGSDMPLAINILGSPRRIELALGRHPQEVGDSLQKLIEAGSPPRPKKIADEWRTIGRLLRAQPRRVRRAIVQEINEEPDLKKFPILKCWPKDAARFLTCGMVITHDPETDARNMGIYRMQVSCPDKVIMHWQIQKGGGFHHWKAEQQGKALAVSVAIGGDPLLYLAAVAPLPEGMDELSFAGFLRGKPIPIILGRTGQTIVPAECEIVLEGLVMPDERMDEGPFGDHFGHYSHPAPFPALWLESASRRRNAIYLAAVVGKPPQEDRYMGDAVQELMLPMIRMIHPELKDIWAYYEAGFHSLVAVSVIQRFGKEGMKTALGLFGTGQMALTKCLVLVDADVDARDIRQVLSAIRQHFDPAEDFLLLPGVPFDTLDFTSFTLNLGSKMVLDATRSTSLRVASRAESKDAARHSRQTREPVAEGRGPGSNLQESQVQALHSSIRRVRLIDGALLAVQVTGEGRPVVEALVKAPMLSGVKLIAVVSNDVDIDYMESLLWGIFTRFDPARDVVFSKSELNGSWPVHRGCLGIDATFKKGYPDPVVMDPAIVKHVDAQWAHYSIK